MSDYQAIYDAVRSRISGGNISQTVAEVARHSFDISNVIVRAQEQVYVVADAMTRPSVLYRPTVAPDGTKWCALYGSNLMEGVAGFGDTPEEAMKDFDRAWFHEVTPEHHRIVDAITDEEARGDILDNGQFGVGA